MVDLQQSQISQFLNSRDISDKMWLKDFQSYLLNINNKNTVSRQLGCIRIIVKEAVKDRLTTNNDNPFIGYELSYEENERHKLTDDEFRQIEELKLDQSLKICHARDIFLFMYYCHGMRIGDALFVRVSSVYHEGDQLRLQYIMQKTSLTKNVLLGTKAKALYEKYSTGKKPSDFLFPFIKPGTNHTNPIIFRQQKEAKTTSVNKNLTKIQKLLNLPNKLTCHIARHTFADTARKKGISTYNISKALGHTRISTTEQYLKGFDQNAVDSVNEIYE